MKRRVTLSLALTMSVLLSLVSLPATASAQFGQSNRIMAVVTPAVGQTLRVTVVGTNANHTIRVRIRWMEYTATGCSGAPPVCRHMVVAQGATPMETLGPDEALSMDVPGNGNGMRLIVDSNSRNARVVAQLLEVATGKVVAVVPLVPVGTD